MLQPNFQSGPYNLGFIIKKVKFQIEIFNLIFFVELHLKNKILWMRELRPRFIAIDDKKKFQLTFLPQILDLICYKLSGPGHESKKRPEIKAELNRTESSLLVASGSAHETNTGS